MNTTEELLGAVRAMVRLGKVARGAVLELRLVPNAKLPGGVVRDVILASRRRDLEGRV